MMAQGRDRTRQGAEEGKRGGEGEGKRFLEGAFSKSFSQQISDAPLCCVALC